MKKEGINSKEKRYKVGMVLKREENRYVLENKDRSLVKEIKAKVGENKKEKKELVYARRCFY